MGIRCSLTGHRFEETEVEQEREEEDGKVVLTTKEYDVCLRCGQRSLNNETTEVTSMDPETQSDDSLPDSTETVKEEPATPAEPEDAGIILEDSADEPAAPGSDTDSASEQTQPADDHPQSSETPWPEHDDPTEQHDGADTNWPTPDQPKAEQPTTEPTPWPEHEDDDEGISAHSPGGDDADVEYVGLTPTSDATAQPDDPEEIAAERETATPAIEDTGSPSRAMDLVCPACGFIDGGGHGSLRRGDICPECLDGYLAVDEEHNK